MTSIIEWMTADLFVSVLEKNVENFEKLISVSADTPFAAGENFLSDLWAFEIEAALKDGSTKVVKYMLKVPPTAQQAFGFNDMLNSFHREHVVYYELLPAIDEMYRKGGKNTRIATKVHKFDKDLGFDVILMEDLRGEGFKNMNRLEGLDMEHTTNALEVIAKFHAASANYIAVNGSLPQLLMESTLNEDMLNQLVKPQKPEEQLILDSLALYKAENLREKMANYQPQYVRQMLEADKRDIDDFNVLSHGDCCSKNIMFKHNDQNSVCSTVLVNFQAGRISSPALDLQYFLLGSTCLENKVKYFDYFVQYYHQQLFENLKVLKYPKKMPTLRDVHKWMFDFGFVAYTVILKSLPVILLDPKVTENIDMDNMMDAKTDSGAMQKAMYTGEGYCKHMQTLLPWMANRGYLS